MKFFTDNGRKCDENESLSGGCSAECATRRITLEMETAFSTWRPGRWVFASLHTKGRQPYWPELLWRYDGKPALKRAGVTKQVSFHTFRHTFGTLLNANGENSKVVQELLRHASLKVTTDVYMQAVGPQKREAQSNLVKLVRKGLASETRVG